jgi:triosephosphate isomerase (TIM)
MRTPLVIGNWKMHAGRPAEARDLAQAVRDGLKRPRGVEVGLCPPFTALPAVADTLAGSPLLLGAQNCHWEDAGAFTGEIAPAMLADLGCRLVLVGHSERRQLFHETDAGIQKKVAAALRHRLTPVLCVGETAEERRQGLTFTVVEGQLRAGWAGLGAEDIGRCVLAYEPVWAIGTGQNATPAQAAEVHGYLRGIASELASKEIAQSVRILYGGSVKPDNAGALAQEQEIDGALVGGASLQAAGFITIAKKSAAKSGAAKE